MNRTVLITDGDLSIAAACKDAFAASGDRVIFLGNEKPWEDSDRAICITADMTDDKDVREGFAKARAVFGDVDVLILNLPVYPEECLFEELTEEDWNESLQKFLMPDFYAVREAVPAMKKKEWGRVITICSEEGSIGAGKRAAFGTLQASRIGFSESLGREISMQKISANAVTVSVRGEQSEEIMKEIPFGRTCLATDVAVCVHFLASDEAAYLCGQVISPNGGRFTPV